MSAATAHLARREPHICRDGDDHEDDRHEDEARRRARAAGARRHAHAHHCERNADARMRASPSPTALAPRVRSCRVGAVPALLRLCRGPRAGLAACGRAVWRAPPPPLRPSLLDPPALERRSGRRFPAAQRARRRYLHPLPSSDSEIKLQARAIRRYALIVTRQPSPARTRVRPEFVPYRSQKNRKRPRSRARRGAARAARAPRLRPPPPLLVLDDFLAAARRGARPLPSLG